VALRRIYRQNYNTNSVAVSTYRLAGQESLLRRPPWTPRSWFALDAGYSKLHLGTSYPVLLFLQTTSSLRDSIRPYISKHSRLPILARDSQSGKRAELYVGYTITKGYRRWSRSGRRRGTTDPKLCYC